MPRTTDFTDGLYRRAIVIPFNRQFSEDEQDKHLIEKWHLKILERAGIVDSQKDGLWVNYFLADGRSTPYAASLLGHLKHWLAHDPSIEGLLEKLPAVNREEITGS